MELFLNCCIINLDRSCRLDHKQVLGSPQTIPGIGGVSPINPLICPLIFPKPTVAHFSNLPSTFSIWVFFRKDSPDGWVFLKFKFIFLEKARWSVCGGLALQRPHNRFFSMIPQDPSLLLAWRHCCPGFSLYGKGVTPEIADRRGIQLRSRLWNLIKSNTLALYSFIPNPCKQLLFHNLNPRHC